VQDYVKKIFADEYVVVLAEDGVVAMEKLEDLTPDLIILDIMMPRKDGNEVFAELKADPRLASVPVIMFTAMSSEENRLDGLERGADDYIGKPFNPRELLARTKNLIQLRAQERELLSLNRELEDKVRKQVGLIVAERKRYEAELIAAKNRSESSDKVKTFILNNLSHEIRTPVTNILGFAEILKDRVTDEERPFMEYIESNSKRLLETVSTILDFSQLTTKSFDLYFGLASLNTIMDDAASRFRSSAESKGLKLVWSKNDQEDHQIVIDRSALDSILNQIIGNAVKFTKWGTVTLDAGVHSDRVIIRVQDTGVGIDEKFVESMFEPFHQESTGDGRSFEGTGLGLTIARQLVELMGGKIKVASNKGNGSVFSVIVPDFRSLRRSATTERADREPAQSESSADEKSEQNNSAPAEQDAVADAE
jgi:signal transduction histidine kinase